MAEVSHLSPRSSPCYLGNFSFFRESVPQITFKSSRFKSWRTRRIRYRLADYRPNFGGTNCERLFDLTPMFQHINNKAAARMVILEHHDGKIIKKIHWIPHKCWRFMCQQGIQILVKFAVMCVCFAGFLEEIIVAALVKNASEQLT